MNKSIINKIFSLILVLLVAVVIVPNTKIIASDDLEVIEVNGVVYNLKSDELPSGLTWDDPNNTLIMEEYDGGYIKDDRSSTDKAFNIQIQGENIINFDNEAGIYSQKLNIFGDDKNTDKLIFKGDGDTSRAIFSTRGGTFTKFTLDINFKSSYKNQSISGIQTIGYDEDLKFDDAILDIKMEKVVGTHHEMIGTAGNLKFSNESTAKMTLLNTDARGETSPLSTNTGTVAIKGTYYVEAVFKQGHGTESEPYIFKAKVAADRDKILVADLNEGELYTDPSASAVDEVTLSEGSAGTTFYVKRGASGSEKWYQFTVVRDGEFHEAELVRSVSDTQIASFKAGTEVFVGVLSIPAGKIFDHWISNPSVIFNDERSVFTSFTMPGNDIKVEPVFRSDISIRVAGTEYVLGLDTLPAGLEWDIETDVLTMDGYNGGPIREAKSKINKEFNINVKGENTITFDDFNEGIFFDKLNIFGSDKDNDKLILKGEGDQSRAIYNPYDATFSKLTLVIDFKASDASNPIQGIQTTNSEQELTFDDAYLEMDMEKVIGSNRDVVGTAGKLILLNGSKATMKLKNTDGSGTTSPLSLRVGTVVIYGTHYVEAEFEENQGIETNPYVIEATVAEDRESITTDDLNKGELYNDPGDTSSVDKVNLSDGTSTTFYVKRDVSGVETWYKFIVVRDGKFYEAEIHNGESNSYIASYKKGTEVHLGVFKTPSGKEFIKWVSDPEVIFNDVTSKNTHFEMPEDNVKVEAIFDYVSTYEVTVNGGSGSGSYPENKVVTIEADLAPAGKEFDKWTSPDGVVFADEAAAKTTFTMINKKVSITANYKDKEYNVTVQNDGNGIASASLTSAEAGKDVVLTSIPNTGYRFKEWEVVSGGITITDNKFKMPDNDVMIKAIFEKEVVAPTYTYKITSGADQTWVKGSSKDLEIVVDGEYGKFVEIQFNGSNLSNSYYKTKEGSTIITIASEYLESLKEGVHDLTIVFKGTDPVKTTLAVKAQEQEKPVDAEEDKLPGMGDNYFQSYLALLLVVIGSVFAFKRQPQKE